MSAAAQVHAPSDGGVPPGAARPEAKRPLAGNRVEGPRLRDAGRKAFHQQGAGEEARGVLPRPGGPVSLSRGTPTRPVVAPCRSLNTPYADRAKHATFKPVFFLP